MSTKMIDTHEVEMRIIELEKQVDFDYETLTDEYERDCQLSYSEGKIDGMKEILRMSFEI